MTVTAARPSADSGANGEVSVSASWRGDADELWRLGADRSGIGGFTVSGCFPGDRPAHAPQLHQIMDGADQMELALTSRNRAETPVAPLPSGGKCATCRPRRILAMTRVQPKAMPNWCLQVKPDEPWTGRCVKEKIADDGKRHRCHKTEKHSDAVHACQCSLEWKQF